MSRRVGIAVALTLVLAAGCGPGAGGAANDVSLTITDDFGQTTLLDQPSPDVRGGDTVMRLLQRNAKVTTRYGGGFVQSIDARAGGRENGRPADWFFFVNGLLAEKGAASVKVHGGERIWWDRHDWGAADRVPAVVGSFPEPFVHGVDGHRRPIRLECDPAVQSACDTVQKKFADLDVVAGEARIGTERGQNNIRILVGLWPAVRADLAAEQLEKGPQASGVYARISPDGKTITALDARGRPARTLGPGVGLVAATRFREDDPVWLVTGTDAAGVNAAATEAFDESVLNRKFALAISGGLPVPLPLTAKGTSG